MLTPAVAVYACMRDALIGCASSDADALRSLTIRRVTTGSARVALGIATP